MNLLESLRISMGSLAANKLRATLTMLGIIIGVAAVITLLSVGQGVQVTVEQQIQSIGSNLLFVFAGNLSNAQTGNFPTSQSEQLTYGDAKALEDRARVPDVTAVTVEYSRNATVVYRGKEIVSTVTGTTPNYDTLRNFPAEIGRFFTEEEMAGTSRVAVIGRTVAETLFNDAYPIGELIRINQVPFHVIGILESKGGSGFSDQDNVVLIPLTAAQKKLFQRRSASGDYIVSLIYAQVSSERRVEQAMEQVTQVLRDRHGIAYSGEDDFTVINQKDVLNIFGEITGILTLFLGAIAAISLLVGGIGIMNIMLVSVTERTREIGLRKAVGAKRRDILWQFLIEAMMLSLVGGMIGIGIGAAGSQLVGRLSEDFSPVTTLSTVLLATGFSAAVGLFFGIYPANRAAQLNPIDALRYE